jgi:hypothetical protein
MLRRKQWWGLRRTLALLTVAGGLVAVTAAPALALANPTASCKGISTSDFADFYPGAVGDARSENAQLYGGVGQDLGAVRSCGAGQSPHTGT